MTHDPSSYNMWLDITQYELISFILPSGLLSLCACILAFLFPPRSLNSQSDVITKGMVSSVSHLLSFLLSLFPSSSTSFSSPPLLIFSLKLYVVRCSHWAWCTKYLCHFEWRSPSLGQLFNSRFPKKYNLAFSTYSFSNRLESGPPCVLTASPSACLF